MCCEGCLWCTLAIGLESTLATPFISRTHLPLLLTTHRRYQNGCHDCYHADDPLRRPAQRGPEEDCRSTISNVWKQADYPFSKDAGDGATPPLLTADPEARTDHRSSRSLIPIAFTLSHPGPTSKIYCNDAFPIVRSP